MNNIILYCLFIIGILFSASFYTLGSYFFRLGEKYNMKFIYIYILSIICGILSYSVKVPIFYYIGKKMNVMLINIIFLITVFIVVTLYSKFILNEIIPLHTYIILTLIILLIILNHFLDNK
jgi:hypothetical protein